MDQRTFSLYNRPVNPIENETLLHIDLDPSVLDTPEFTLYCVNCLVAPMAIGLHCVGCHNSILAELRGKAQYDAMPAHESEIPLDL